jgi:hypothetical protein
MCWGMMVYDSRYDAIGVWGCLRYYVQGIRVDKLFLSLYKSRSVRELLRDVS